MYDFEEIIYYGCVLCNQRTEWENDVCYDCMEYYEELAYSFCDIEGLEDDEYNEVEEKYNEMDYNIFYERKRAYTI